MSPDSVFGCRYLARDLVTRVDAVPDTAKIKIQHRVGTIGYARRLAACRTLKGLCLTRLGSCEIGGPHG